MKFQLHFHSVNRISIVSMYNSNQLYLDIFFSTRHSPSYSNAGPGLRVRLANKHWVFFGKLGQMPYLLTDWFLVKVRQNISVPETLWSRQFFYQNLSEKLKIGMAAAPQTKWEPSSVSETMEREYNQEYHLGIDRGFIRICSPLVPFKFKSSN